MTIQETIRNVSKRLLSVYEAGETSTIAHWIVEYVTGYDRSISSRSGTIRINQIHAEKIESILQRVLKHEPVQYVLNEAWFYSMKFYVDENVLIPRPETEELVECVLKEHDQVMKMADKNNADPGISRNERSLQILDIGTGSGCIPIVLKKKLEKADVWSCDISGKALEVARQNATNKKTDIHFLQMDFLQQANWANLPVFDIIISNPPYVTQAEKAGIPKNVLNHEPATALFVPEDDPLTFYQAIAEFSQTKLNSSGKIYCEINETLAKETMKVFTAKNFTSIIKKDMQGKDRIIIAYRESKSERRI